MRRPRPFASYSLLAATMFATLVAPSADAQSSNPVGPVVSTAWLAANLERADVVLLMVTMEPAHFRRGHITGARNALYMEMTVDRDGLSAEIAPLPAIERHLESLGVSDTTHVILTGSAMQAARIFYTLEQVGLRRVSLLDGGLTKWRAEGRPWDSLPSPRVPRGDVTLQHLTTVRITADQLLPRLGRSGISLFDTREQGEYDGTADRRGHPSFGHLPGARRITWQETMRDQREFWLKDRDALERMWAERMVPGDTVVTYCWVGMRASVTYAVSRYLGYPTRMYDGSDEEWQARGLPMTREATPLRRVP